MYRLTHSDVIVKQQFNAFYLHPCPYKKVVYKKSLSINRPCNSISLIQRKTKLILLHEYLL
jgi:hypothetical protein